MRYVSTRGQAPVRDFSGVLLAGLAEARGLYVPETWPALTHADWRALRGLPYAELAARLLALFVGDCLPFATLQAVCRDAYAGFGHPAVAPLVHLDHDLFACELFHGPTLSFKDMALQVLGRLFDHVLAERDAELAVQRFHNSQVEPIVESLRSQRHGQENALAVLAGLARAKDFEGLERTIAQISSESAHVL